MALPTAPDVDWSDRVEEADWVAQHLAPFGDATVGSVVPRRFPAYGRVLHPLRTAPPERGKVRWSEVATWSGRVLRPDGDFHSVAFPLGDRQALPPWWGQGPARGTLDAGDAAALLGILRAHTTTPARCWFCLWAGYGWTQPARARFGSTNAADPDELEAVPDPIPRHVREGPLVELPGRSYFLYAGPVESALAFVASEGRTPNLFWPSDRAWCVASEIDLTSTYVGGSVELVEALLVAPGLEVVAVEPTQRTVTIEPWVVADAACAARALLATGNATIVTTAGTVQASLERSGLRHREAALTTSRAKRDGGRGGGWHRIGTGTDADLRGRIELYLTQEIVSLVE